MLNASLEFKEGYLSLDAVDWQEQGKIIRQLTVHIRKELEHDPSVYVGDYIETGISNFILRIINIWHSWR